MKSIFKVQSSDSLLIKSVLHSTVLSELTDSLRMSKVFVDGPHFIKESDKWRCVCIKTLLGDLYKNYF